MFAAGKDCSRSSRPIGVGVGWETVRERDDIRTPCPWVPCAWDPCPWVPCPWDLYPWVPWEDRDCKEEEEAGEEAHTSTHSTLRSQVRDATPFRIDEGITHVAAAARVRP